VALGRKNWIHFGSQEAGPRIAAILSIAGIQWGRLIFHVSDVDRFWAYLTEKGFHPVSVR
jgi:hypothetical protein